MRLLSELKKIRVQHVTRGDDGLEVKTDVDVLTDASAVTMDGKDLKSGIGDMIDGRIEELIDGAPEELDTLKEIADELAENQSGVTTIIKKLGDKADRTDIKTKLSEMTEDESHRTVTDTEKNTWNNKVDKDGNKILSTNDFTNALKAKVDALEVQNDNKKLLYKQKKNTDFNSITEAGFYTVKTTTNAPHSKYNYWAVIVTNSTGVDNTTYVQQIAINEKSDDRAIYVRKKSSSWSSWIKLEAKPDLSNFVTKVNGKGLSTNDYTTAEKNKLSGIEAGAEKNKVNSVNGQTGSVNIEIPSKLSQLTNDKNYKTEAEIQAMISSASSLKKEIVTSLPSSGKDDVIYLVKDSKGEAGNVYLEYLWIAGAFELIGSTKMDLTGYAKKTDIKTKLADMTGDSTHRLVTDEEKKKWNGAFGKVEDSVNIAMPNKKTLVLTQKEYDYLENKDQSVEYNIRTSDIRVLFITNQFFAQDGGEEAADNEPYYKLDEVAISSLVMRQLTAKSNIANVGTLVVPDNALNNQYKDAVYDLIIDTVNIRKPDIIIVTPAFNANKFAENSSKLCLFIMEKLGIPAVASIYSENEFYKKYKGLIHMVDASLNPAGIRNFAPKLADYALQILRESYDKSSYIKKLGEMATRIIKNEEAINEHKKIKILTQSEYDALSNEEKNRADTLYFIKK